MNKKELEAFAKEMTSGIKIGKASSEISNILTKTFVEVALNTEFDEHLNYDKHASSDTKTAVMVSAENNCKPKMAPLDSQ